MKITVLTLLSLFCFFFFSCSSENEQEVNRVNSQVENTESGDLEVAAEEKPAKLDLTLEGDYEVMGEEMDKAQRKSLQKLWGSNERNQVSNVHLYN